MYTSTDQSTNRLEIVDFLKGFSIFTVILMHLLQMHGYDTLPGWAQKAISFGGAGVHVFILCSGFGLYLSYLHRPTSYGTFLRKRFTRIYWPMAIVCIATAIWLIVQGEEFLMPLLGNLFLFKMFAPSLNESMGGHLWFVSTIIQFYLVWPLIVALMRRFHHVGVYISLVISLIYATAVALIGLGDQRVWNSFFLQYLWEFCIGMMLAEIYFRYPATSMTAKWKYLIPACVGGIVLTGIMGWMGTPWNLYNDIPSLIGYMSFAIIIYRLGHGIINSAFLYTSRFSYEWYLIHILVFQILIFMLADRLSAIALCAVCLATSYVVAIWYQYAMTRLMSRVNYAIST